MLAVSQSPIDIGKLPRELAAREKAIKSAIARGIRNGIRRGRTLLVQRTPVDTGLLKASWRDSGVRIEPGGGLMAELWNDAPHAGIVEEGARPHSVSAAGRQAIYEWARRHFPGAGDRAWKSITWAICKRLRERGQPGKFFIRDSRVELARLMVDEIIYSVSKVANRPRVSP